MPAIEVITTVADDTEIVTAREPTREKVLKY